MARHTKHSLACLLTDQATIIINRTRALQATSNSSEMKRLQTGDIDYKEATAAADMKARIEVDGIKAEKNASVLKVCYGAANLHAQYGPFHSIKSFDDYS